MRVLIAEIKHEANTFSPVATTLQDFYDYHFYEGVEIERLRGTRTEVGGFLDVAMDEGWQVVPALATMAMPAGKVTADAYAVLKDKLLTAIHSAEKLDAILLALHGAMAVEGLDNADGDLLAAVRSAAGAQLPVVVSLDLHANLTPQMVEQATIIVGFDTCPHTDLYETGCRAARLCGRLARGEINPAMALVRIPLIVPPDTMDTSEGPLGEIVRRAKTWEDEPGILSASVFCVQPWLDVPSLASAVLVITDGMPYAAEKAARDLAYAYWNIRQCFTVQLWAPEDAVALAIAEGQGPIVFADSADSIGSGSTGDATGILRALLAVRTQLSGPALTMIVDPEAAAQAIAAGQDAEVTLSVGGKRDTIFSKPVKVTGRVQTIFDGRFTLSGPSYAGLEMNMGPTAVIQCDRVFVAIISIPTWTHSPDFYHAVGLMPEKALIVVTKSNSLFKAFYKQIAKQMLQVDGGGLSSPNLTRLPFQRISRPLYPFDDMEVFDDRVTFHVR